MYCNVSNIFFTPNKTLHEEPLDFETSPVGCGREITEYLLNYDILKGTTLRTSSSNKQVNWNAPISWYHRTLLVNNMLCSKHFRLLKTSLRIRLIVANIMCIIRSQSNIKVQPGEYACIDAELAGTRRAGNSPSFPNWETF